MNKLFITYACEPYGDDEWEIGQSDTEVGAMKCAIDDFLHLAGEDEFKDYTCDLNLPENWREDENSIRAVYRAISEDSYFIRCI